MLCIKYCKACFAIGFFLLFCFIFRSAGMNPDMDRFATLAVLDLETDDFIKHNQPQNTKILELSIVACSVHHLLAAEKQSLPRVMHKLTMTFGPGTTKINKEASAKTGLTNQLLENEREFNVKSANLVKDFVANLQQPVCVTAHNGNYFDFAILRAHLNQFGVELSSIFCVDSLDIFKKILKPNSFKLVSIYRHLFDSEPSYCHTSEADTYTLLKCIKATKYLFIDLAMLTAKPF